MYALFDIGGTKTRVACSSDLSTFEAPIVFDTPKNYKEGFDALVKTIKEALNGREPKAICGGIAGPIDKNGETMVRSPNLDHWVNKPLKQDLIKEFNTEIFLENDAALAGLGEAVYGAGVGSNIVAYMTVSTGVGGARIVNGVLDEKSTGFEPGHQTIDADHTLEKDVSSMDLSDILGGRGVEKRMGKKPKEITDKKFWEQMAKYLAYALNNVTVFWSPDCIVLGGSMITGDPSIPIRDTEDNLKRILKIFPHAPCIKKAKLGDLGGLYGALAYLKNLK